MNAWSHLPNSHHIDRVIESVKSHPEIWRLASDAAWDTASGAALGAAWGTAWVTARVAALSTAALNADWNAARYAIIALIAYDNASKYLDMPSDKLRVWALRSEDPAAVLLLPAVIAFERIRELGFS
jgi:hypothetical protein